jgi:probable HAF family extracellular repeat protein
VDLGSLGGSDSHGVGVNDLGQVTGWFTAAGGAEHAFRWTAAGGMQDLGTLGGPNSVPFEINDLGQVTGSSDTSATTPGSPETHAFRWTASRGMQDLGTLGGTSSSSAGINDVGQVTGQAQTSTGAFHAVRWTPRGSAQDLGTLGGTESFSCLCGWGSTGINELGQVTGEVQTTTGADHPFRWAPSGGMQDLGTLGGEDGWAFGINDLGQVTGQSQTAAGPTHAFVWTPQAWGSAAAAKSGQRHRARHSPHGIRCRTNSDAPLVLVHRLGCVAAPDHGGAELR